MTKLSHGSDSTHCKLTKHAECIRGLTQKNNFESCLFPLRVRQVCIMLVPVFLDMMMRYQLPLTYFYYTTKLSSQEIWLTTLKVYLKLKSAAEGWRKKSTLNHACSRFSGHDDEVPFRRSSIIWLESRNFEVDLNYFIRSFVI